MPHSMFHAILKYENVYVLQVSQFFINRMSNLDNKTLRSSSACVARIVTAKDIIWMEKTHQLLSFMNSMKQSSNHNFFCYISMHSCN